MSTTWQIPSDRSERVYTCVHDEQGWTCECVNFAIQQNKNKAAGIDSAPICKHIRKAVDQEKKLTSRYAAPATVMTPEEDGPTPVESVVLLPMLAQEISPHRLILLAEDPNLYFEQKMDGERILICRTDGLIQCLNREGKLSKYNNELISTGPYSHNFNRLDKIDFIFDAEILNDGSIYIFDVLKIGDSELDATTPYSVRRKALDLLSAEWKPVNPVHILQSMSTYEDKLELVRRAIQARAEGIMVKKGDAPYHAGKRSQAWVKAKFTKSIDCVVTAVDTDGKQNAALHIYSANTNEIIPIGSVSTIGKPDVKVGSIVEVEYLYASDDKKLVQPRIKRIRTDKNAVMCRDTQLKNTNRGLIHLTP